MKLKAVFFFLSLLCSISLLAQKTHHKGKNGNFEPGAPVIKPKTSSINDSVIHCFSIGGSFAYQLPGGNLRWRFGDDSNVGLSFQYKTNKNFFYGFQWTYIFGNQLRGANPLAIISTSDGYVIDKEGKFADIRIFERGFTLGLSGGKVFNGFLSPNKNSGFLLTGGVGYLQHKYKIYDNGARAPQLTKPYLKGYDHLTSGTAFTEFIGYWFMSRSRYVNFYGGFEFTQALTMSRRSWDYTLMARDTTHRIDLLSGFRVGWVIPMYRRTSHNYYY